MDVRQWRLDIRSRLAEARAALLVELLGLGRETLTGAIVHGGLTVSAILLKRMEEDTLCTRAMGLEHESFPSHDTVAGVTQSASPLQSTLTAFLDARRLMLDLLAGLPDEEIFRPRESGAIVAAMIEESGELDRRAAADIRSWRAREHPLPVTGPMSVLIAASRASRKELLTAIALVPAFARPKLTLDGGESLAAALRAIADNEGRIIESVTGEAGVYGSDVSWNAGWRRFHDTHHRLLTVLQRLAGGDVPSTPADTFYGEVCTLIARDRRYADAVRGAASLRTPVSIDAPSSPARTASRTPER